MAHGVEVSVPFLDNDLVDFCQGLPLQSRLGQTSIEQTNVGVSSRTSNGKQLLRESMNGALPSHILEATKQGFSGPDTTWFAQELRSDVFDCLDSLDPEIATPRLVAEALTNSPEASGSNRLLSWSIMAASMHLQDCWPSGGPSVSKERSA